jgi:ADP-Ribosyltransferase in polyvalent proteins
MAQFDDLVDDFDPQSARASQGLNEALPIIGQAIGSNLDQQDEITSNAVDAAKNLADGQSYDKNALLAQADQSLQPAIASLGAVEDIPKTFYHGTSSTVAGDLKANPGLYGKGVYISEKPQLASQYAGPNGNVLPVSADIKNAFNLEAPADEKLKASILNDSQFKGNKSYLKNSQTNDDLHSFMEDTYSPEQYTELLKKHGYDALEIPSRGITNVFDPNAVQSKFKSSYAEGGTVQNFDDLVDDSQAQNPSPNAPAAKGEALPNFDQLQDDSQTYGSPTEMAKTALEQGLSGATLGASKVLETHGIPALGIPAITTPEAIAGREAANPITSSVSNIAGTAGAILGTGGLGALGEGAGIAARVGLNALEGAGIGGISTANDDWSQNKALDAQKIAANAGLGSLLGGVGGVIGEAFKPKALTEVPTSISDQAASAADTAANASGPPVKVPEVKGVQPSSYDDIVNRVKEAKVNGTAEPLPAQTELDDALSRIGMENPVNPLQRDSLASQEANDVYQTAKEAPGELGNNLKNYEALQKNELVNKTNSTLSDLSPSGEPISDAYQGGKQAIDAFTNQYQAERDSLSPLFQSLKTLPVQGELLPDSISRMTQAVPGIANMFDTAGDAINIRPYKTAWGIDKATYNAVKDAVNGLQDEPNNLQTLWNVRKGLDQHIDVLAQGQAPQEIRSLKAALMDQMQDSTGNPNIRDAFRRYAINEQQRQVIEKSFGASVGTPEFGQISKVKPEMIGDKIFGNTATVQAAKNILPQNDFNSILANWLSEGKAAATDKGAFSANKFGSFLKRNQDALGIAFQDQPEALQRLKDLTTIMRILPDAPSINPSGTAKTLSRMILGHTPDLHNITWEGMLASIPKKIASEIGDRLKMNELNQYLSGQALKNSQQVSLKNHVFSVSDKIDKGVKALFAGSGSQVNQNGK